LLETYDYPAKKKEKNAKKKGTGRNLTLPPFFFLSSPKGGEGWGEEVNCF
jgi:hypothetical protein